jgi:hypothetical protein
MADVVQVVDIMPTPGGEWISFWHLGGRIRVSGALENQEQGFVLNLGDIFLCRELDDDSLDVIGPLPVDNLSVREFSRLPVFVDQDYIPAVRMPGRFVLDRNAGVITKRSLSDMLRNPDKINPQSIQKNLEDIAKLREVG